MSRPETPRGQRHARIVAQAGFTSRSQGRLDADAIRRLIETGMPGARVQVQGADGVHFEAVVVSDAFRGKLPLARHRMVYATLGDRINTGQIHALALTTLTPEQAGG